MAPYSGCTWPGVHIYVLCRQYQCLCGLLSPAGTLLFVGGSPPVENLSLYRTWLNVEEQAFEMIYLLGQSLQDSLQCLVREKALRDSLQEEFLLPCAGAWSVSV